MIASFHISSKLKLSLIDFIMLFFFGNHECKDLDVALHKLIIFLFYLLFCIGNERFVCGVLRVALDEDDSKAFSRLHPLTSVPHQSFNLYAQQIFHKGASRITTWLGSCLDKLPRLPKIV